MELNVEHRASFEARDDCECLQNLLHTVARKYGRSNFYRILKSVESFDRQTLPRVSLGLKKKTLK